MFTVFFLQNRNSKTFCANVRYLLDEDSVQLKKSQRIFSFKGTNLQVGHEPVLMISRQTGRMMIRKWARKKHTVSGGKEYTVGSQKLI